MGPIDALCSDHAPVDEDAKQLPFAESEPGVTGLELLLPAHAQVGRRKMRVACPEALALVTSKPAAILGVRQGVSAVASDADLCVFDKTHTQDHRGFLEEPGKNTPFIGYELPGRVRYTLVAGRSCTRLDFPRNQTRACTAARPAP